MSTITDCVLMFPVRNLMFRKRKTLKNKMISANLTEVRGGLLKSRKSILNRIDRRSFNERVSLRKADMRTMTRRWPDRMITKRGQLEKRNDEKSIFFEFGDRNCLTRKLDSE